MVSQSGHPLRGLMAQRGHSPALAQAAHDGHAFRLPFLPHGRDTDIEPNQRNIEFPLDSGVNSRV